ncbi:hypothetical protein [Streptomyces fructofermentans]|uniref:hypothetical protein n=1 Tax=Streptomyces fructofermentans TaxID=152141 RepID=UPI003793184B
MTTHPPFASDRPGISPESVIDPPPSPPAAPRPGVDRSADRYEDPIDGLVHAAVADRPLDEVVQLIEALERSPRYARATVDALRAVGTDRSVEDVTRLVTLLTRPPRNADSADEAIRAAAGGRTVEDVTRLMALLHQPSVEPHCGEAAVRAAATTRPVEDLARLIGRMTEQQAAEESTADDRANRPADGSQADGSEGTGRSEDTRGTTGAMTAGANGVDPGSVPGAPVRPRAAGAGLLPERSRQVAALALVACGVAQFPSGRDGAPVAAYGLAIGTAVLCLLLGVALLRTGRAARLSFVLLVLGVVMSAAPAAGRLLEARLGSAGLSRALGLTLAPPWLAGAAAALAALSALTALLVLVTARGAASGSDEVRSPAGSRRNEG